jgi:short-subunit dehydrogenase
MASTENEIEHLGTALITGASSGIGAVYADRMAKRGYDLLLVARNQDKLESRATDIRQKTGRQVRVLPADLTQSYDLACVEEALRHDETISVLINCAGFGSSVPLLKADVGRMEEMIKINVTALMRLTYAVVPQFVERKRGTIIQVSSIVAIAPEILNGVYGGTKSFVLGLTHSMQHELRDTGIRIQAVLPGGTRTEFFTIAGSPIEHMPEERRQTLMSAEDLVDAALAGLDQGELITIPPLADKSEWDDFEAARLRMTPRLRNAQPAQRYLTR